MYTIGQVSKIIGLPISTLRYYDKIGLLPNLKRNISGIREFDEKDIEGLKIIECLKTSKMEIKDIKAFLKWCTEGDSTLEKRKEMFVERKKIIEEQLKELEKTLEIVNYKCWYYDRAIVDGTEDIIKNSDIAFQEKPSSLKST